MVPSASFEPSSFEAPADRTSSKASKKHCRDRPAASTATHRPCSRARQTSGGGRVQNPLAGGTELTFCSLVPSGASQSGAAPDRGTARNRRGFHGTRWAHAPRGLVSPQSAAGSTVWPEEGGRVVGCEHPGRSQKPHEKRRNCLPPPRCCHVALLQGQGPGPDRWRACTWDEGRGPGSRRRPCCPHSPHCVAAGCWQPTLTPGTSELQCWRVPKLGPALCPRTGHAARWAVMDTRSRLALQDDGWAGTEGPSFCAPLARYGTLLRSRPVQAPCIISTQTWCGVPNGDPWDLVPFPRCLPRSSHQHGYPAAHAAPSLCLHSRSCPAHGSIIARYLGSSRTHPSAAIQSFSTFVPGASPNRIRPGAGTFSTPSSNVPPSLTHVGSWARQPDTQPATTLAANGKWCRQGADKERGTLVLGWLPHKVRSTYTCSTCSLRQSTWMFGPPPGRRSTTAPWKVTQVPVWTKLRQRFSPFRLIAPLDRPRPSCGPLLQPTDTQRQSKPRRTWKECGLGFFPSPSLVVPHLPATLRGPFFTQRRLFARPSIPRRACCYDRATDQRHRTPSTPSLPPPSHPHPNAPCHPFKGWGACSSIPARTYDADHQSHGQARLTRILAHSMPKRPGASSRYVSSPSPSRDTSPRRPEPRCLAKQGLIITPVPMSPFAP